MVSFAEPPGLPLSVGAGGAVLAPGSRETPGAQSEGRARRGLMCGGDCVAAQLEEGAECVACGEQGEAGGGRLPWTEPVSMAMVTCSSAETPGALLCQAPSKGLSSCV